MKKEKPILFSTAMVQALMNGSKTMTRRIVKGIALEWLTEFTPEYVADPGNWFCPFGEPGDILWVRESFIDLNKTPVVGTGAERYAGLNYWYKADNVNKEMEVSGRYSPSIHMPRKACRILLEITGVKIERLQDISRKDAQQEGIEFSIQWWGEHEDMDSYKDYLKDSWFMDDPAKSFESLWKSINSNPDKPEAHWDSNPWVWVISLRKLTAEEVEECEICHKKVFAEDIQYTGLDGEVQICKRCEDEHAEVMKNCKHEFVDGACEHCLMMEPGGIYDEKEVDR